MHVNSLREFNVMAPDKNNILAPLERSIWQITVVTKSHDGVVTATVHDFNYACSFLVQ